MEATTATNVPATVWPSASVGIEFNVRKRAAISLGGGYIGYFNALDKAQLWFYQLGVSLFFDAFPRHGHRAPATAPPTAPIDDDEPPPADGHCVDDDDGPDEADDDE